MDIKALGHVWVHQPPHKCRRLIIVAKMCSGCMQLLYDWVASGGSHMLLTCFKGGHLQANLFLRSELIGIKLVDDIKP